MNSEENNNSLSFEEIGFILRQAREKKGLSFSQVSECTKIRKHYIDAMESGNFQELPDYNHSVTYVISYLKHYAKFLGVNIDFENFIEHLNNQPSRQTSSVSSLKINNISRKAVILSVIITLILLVSFVALGKGRGGVSFQYQQQPKNKLSVIGALSPH